MHAVVPDLLAIFNGIPVTASHCSVTDLKDDYFFVPVEEESRFLLLLSGLTHT